MSYNNNTNMYANLNFGKCKEDEIDLGNGKCAVSFNPCNGNNKSTTGFCDAWGRQQKGSSAHNMQMSYN
jgi:hypothetical protein